MRAAITTTLVEKLQGRDKPYDVRDTKLTGFLVRVNISGKTVYMCEYARGKRVTIGRTDLFTATAARERAKEILGDAAKGIVVNPKKRKAFSITLKEFIENDYARWRRANRKRADEDLKRLAVKFLFVFGNTKLSEINSWLIEQWRTRRLHDGIKPATVNRDIAILKSALTKAVEWEFIEQNPLAKLKPLKLDGAPKVRYLSHEEEQQLRTELGVRELSMIEKRSCANIWRQERGYKLLPPVQANYLKVMVLLSLNTGLRQGELFALMWHNVDLINKLITIEGSMAKSGKTRHIPLNREAYDLLRKWHENSKNEELVFPSKNKRPFNNVKTAWKKLLQQADIQNFRWHDMRHHFASKLVMAGVDLNTVRELLGHSDIKMTLRYAHLAPEHKARAVEKLVEAQQDL